MIQTTTITKRYHFEAAHWLPYVPEFHRCRRIHGHNYEIDVTISGPIDQRGFILDFAELDSWVLPLIQEIDHRTLNDIPGLSNPTAELIGAWFLHRLPQQFQGEPSVIQVRVYETKDCWADVALVYTAYEMHPAASTVREAV